MFNEAIPGPFPGISQRLEDSFSLGGIGLVGEPLMRDWGPLSNSPHSQTRKLLLRERN